MYSYLSKQIGVVAALRRYKCSGLLICHSLVIVLDIYGAKRRSRSLPITTHSVHRTECV